jgi:hypothetical protein
MMVIFTPNQLDQQARYQIQVRGWFSERWAESFSGMQISHQHLESGAFITTLKGPVVDQAALRGILNKIWDFNLALISVELIRNEKERVQRKEQDA